VLAALSTSLVLYFGARAAMRGEIRPGELVVFLSYLKTAIGPVRDLAKYTSRLARASASAERVLEVLDRVPDVRDREDAIPAPVFRGGIRFDHASFSYDRGVAVLSDVDVEIPAGAHVALVGPSGGGKSTLLSAVLRLLDPSEGAVRIDGRDLRDFTIESLRHQIAVVPQQTLLFSGTVAENLGFGRAGSTADEIEAAALAAGAHEFIAALPRGYAEPIGERGADLSVGQRRRISIARANLSRAPIVILDEPLSSLDPENARRVSEALERSIAGRTTLHATHDLEEACRADFVLVIENGRVVEFDRPKSLLEGSGVFARWLELDRRTRDSGGLGAAHAVTG
jgi:ATP-binding cassette subfamily B protein